MRKFAAWIFTGLLLILAVNFPPASSAFARTFHPLSIFNAYDLIDAVNGLRAAHGLPAYNIHPVLMQIAQSQADYMASSGFITHYGPDGSRPFQRALAAGYPVAGDLSLGGFFSENIMGGSDLSAAEAVSAWQGDAPHLNTMLSSNLRDVGAGVARSGNYYYYVLDAGLASGSKPVYTPSGGTPGAGTQEPTIPVAIVSTPLADGSIYHIVEPGQTLWQIAIAYGVTIDQIRRLSNLGSNPIIYPGDKLLIRRAVTATPATPTVTATRDLSTSTPLPPLEVFTDTPTATATLVPAAPAAGQAGTVAVGAIIVVALVVAGLLTWAGRQKSI